MQTQAFETLGIPPTVDGRAIRAAFVRLARIYHPDRFVDQPEEVRREAERRMKEAAAAYEELRTTAKTAAPQTQTQINDKELEERARKYRAAAEEREREDARNRARWMRWDTIEREARQRAEAEAEIAARIKNMNGQPEAPTSSTSVPTERPARPAGPARPLQPASTEPAGSANANYGLGDRLKAARGIRSTSLKPRVAAAD